MDLNTAIYGRRSTRSYTTDTVGDEPIKHLIDAAAHAPNASNEQPWMFTVVRDRDLLDRLSAASKVHMLANLPEGPNAARYRAELSDPDFQIFYDAPALIVISGTRPGRWVAEDCALAAENLMLAAHGMALGTCWIGFAQGYLNTPEGKDALGLPASCVPVAPIIVGHPAATPTPRPRKEPEIHWFG